MKISSSSSSSLVISMRSILVQLVVVLFFISVLIIDGSGGEGGSGGVVLAIESSSDDTSSTDNDNEIDDPHLTSVKRIYDWINAAENGYVNIAKQQPQRLIKNDISTPLIIIAIADIEKNELLVQTPWTHILGPDSDDEEEEDDNEEDEDEEEDEGWYCGTVRTLAKEMKLGNESFYGPYVTYLNNEPDNQLPTQYSYHAKKILDLVVGIKSTKSLSKHGSIKYDIQLRSPLPTLDAYKERLMPTDIHSTIHEMWYGVCGGDKTDIISTKAASFVIQRADDHILIPGYDAYNHRNGPQYLNAQTSTKHGISQNVYASRNIKKGEQIFISYNMCDQCGGRAEYGYGTSEMYRDYGFVEWFPQRWYYPGYGDYDPEDNDLEVNQFDLYENFDEEDGNSSLLELIWTHLTYDKNKLNRFRIYLASELKRLKRIKNINFHNYNWTSDDITDYEWSNINQFIDANIVAMSMALDDITPPPPPPPIHDTQQIVPPIVPDDGVLQKNIVGNGHHYDTLHTKDEIDDIAYHKTTCDNRDQFQYIGYWDTEQNIQSSYYPDYDINYRESFWFNKKPDEINVCMAIDDNRVPEMCSSFRPYHNEYIVHMTARYIKSLRRVLLIGSGGTNSMLLNELLFKYDSSIESIIVIELDQTIIRKNFKHFKTDPYFNDERVEWWFGDINKSLSMLPDTYWGSFDMVLVVDEGIQMLDTLQLLLNPHTESVIVQKNSNKRHLHKYESMFDYVIELNYDNVPMMCSHTLSLGSNTVDFFHDPIYDHGIQEMNNLLYTTSSLDDSSNSRHEYMHDYTQKKKKIGDSDSNGTTCKKGIDDDDDDEVSENPTFAGGIIQIVDAENVSISASGTATTLDIYNLSILIKDTLKNIEGFTFEDDGDDGTIRADTVKEQGLCLFVFNEGYITGRIFDTREKKYSYVGFDINLWTNTNRIDEIRSALIQAVNSNNVSSYRIVVGGMYGASSTWKDDKKHIGPPPLTKHKSHDCNDFGDDDSNGDDDIKIEGNVRLDEDVVSAVAVEEVVSLTMIEDSIVVVVCGKENESGSCTSLTVLKDHDRVKEVIPIYECLTLSKVGNNNIDNNSNEEDTKEVYACEIQIIEELKTKLESNKLHMLVLDGDASYKMHQIFNSILDTHENRERFLQTHSIAVTWSNSEDNEDDEDDEDDEDNSFSSPKKMEPWRREFLEMYRKQIHHDPVKLGEFVIQSKGGEGEGDKSYGLRVVSTNNVDANYEFDKLEKRIQNRLTVTDPSATVELRKIHGGLYNFVEKGKHEPKVFYQKDYNNTHADEHFKSQVILGRQYIFQYETNPEVKKLKDDSLKISSLNEVEQIVYGAMISRIDGLIDLESQAEVTKVRYPVGDGGVCLISSGRFNVIVVWDGRDHVDVNLFVFEDLASARTLKDDVNLRIQQFSVLKDVAIDIQPRGIGRVVNFPEDIVPRANPLDPYLPEENDDEYDDEDDLGKGEL